MCGRPRDVGNVGAGINPGGWAPFDKLGIDPALSVAAPQTRSNAVAWNPMEAFNFTVANEDCNLYTYDMRKLATASCLHKVRPHVPCAAAK